MLTRRLLLESGSGSAASRLVPLERPVFSVNSQEASRPWAGDFLFPAGVALLLLPPSGPGKTVD